MNTFNKTVLAITAATIAIACGNNEDQKPEAIQATDDWLQELKALPYRSCKSTLLIYLNIYYHVERNGKTLYLLKSKSKKIQPKKPRKTYQLLGSIKDFHASRQNITVLP